MNTIIKYVSAFFAITSLVSMLFSTPTDWVFYLHIVVASLHVYNYINAIITELKPINDKKVMAQYWYYRHIHIVHEAKRRRIVRELCVN